MSIAVEHGRFQLTANNKERGDVLPITLIPPDPDEFKEEFLRSRLAEICITYRDGRVQRKKWKVSNFKASSNLMRNLRSRPEFRAGQWQRKGIKEVTVQTLRSD